TIPDVPYYILAGIPQLAAWTMILGRAATYLAFPLYLRFCLLYPVDFPSSRRWAWLKKKRYFYIPYALFGFLCTVILISASYYSPHSPLARRDSLIGLVSRFGTILIYLPVAFYVIYRSYKRVDESTKKKLRLISWGFVIGFVPLVGRALGLVGLGMLPN